MMDHTSQKVSWIDGLVYPNLIHILRCEWNTDIITKHWDFCLLFNEKLREKETLWNQSALKAENSYKFSLLPHIILQATRLNAQ